MKKLLCPTTLFVLTMLSGQATAIDTGCKHILKDSERLACYDQASGRLAPVSISAPDQADERAVSEASKEAAKEAQYEKIRQERVGSNMVDRWELDSSKSTGSFLPRAYKPMYVLPLTYTSDINNNPSSPAVNHTATNTGPPLSPWEAEFQISLKAKLWEHPMGLDANLWAGYTQSSRWQVYTPALSRPFRETNYEPEVMAVFHTPYEILGWHGRIAGVSLTHQSNGRAQPLSRSWNRVIGEIGMEKGDWSLSLRPWWRIKEAGSADDNPGIENYIGRGELLLTRVMAHHVVTLRGRHSLKAGAESRGSAQLDWAFPIGSGVHGYLQLFSGYGESLIDYNIKQNKLGLGISLVEWR
ncbi:phospholipase A [Undibacterium sp. Ren11W]|uniref:phospholipase A n=1 Tax=Undibacterium sp. Ren11W TaxID=3413045 RepID=UPI003BEF9BD3